MFMIISKEDLKGCNFYPLIPSSWRARDTCSCDSIRFEIHMSNVEKKMWKSKIFYVQCPKCPVVRKCCFCIPVRKGIIIFGYINLTFSLLVFPLLIFLLVEQLTGALIPIEEFQYRHRDPIRLPLTVVWVTIDVVMSVALIFAAHKKNSKLLRIYLYLGIIFQVISLFIDLVFLEYGGYIESLIYFFLIGVNLYLLYLVYCTIQTLKESSDVQYVAQRDPPL